MVWWLPRRYVQHGVEITLRRQLTGGSSSLNRSLQRLPSLAPQLAPEDGNFEGTSSMVMARVDAERVGLIQKCYF